MFPADTNVLWQKKKKNDNSFREWTQDIKLDGLLFARVAFYVILLLSFEKHGISVHA